MIVSTPGAPPGRLCQFWDNTCVLVFTTLSCTNIIIKLYTTYISIPHAADAANGQNRMVYVHYLANINDLYSAD